MTKSHILIELDDALIAELDGIRGETPLPELLAVMVKWANGCMKTIAANPEAMRILRRDYPA